jgi:dipeptidase
MCTSVVAGRKATAEGIVVLSRNEDFTRNNWNKYLVYRRVPEYRSDPVPTGGVWTLGNGLTVPIPDVAYAYGAMPDAAGATEATSGISDLYFFEERGINEKNVAVSATNSLDLNDKASAADPLLASGGVAECIIPTLILPQAATALDAVKLLGRYIEEHGASEVNGILFGDPDGAWYFENGSAHHWIAVRVPDDAYLVVANGMRVHGVDLDSPHVLCSKGLYDFVVAHELLAHPDRHAFDFAEAFGKPGDPENEDRIWLAQSILTPSLAQKTGERQYPLFLPPDQPIEVRDVMKVLRATYDGTVLEGKATRPIGVSQTAESHIITLDPNMPDALKGLVWQVVSTPLGAPYMPLFAAMDDIPQGYRLGDNDYGERSAYWAFRGLFALSEVDRKKYLPELVALWHAHEAQSIAEISHVKRMLKEMHGEGGRTALDYARRYSTGTAYDVVGVAHRERNKLMTRLAAEG